MARVQCFDCDMPVVVDPHGRCPEGHDLGPVGERIEQSLGRAEPHPDEPQPWVAGLDTDEVASEPVATATPRPARPISVGPEPSDEERSGSTDGLLQVLHDLHGSGATPAGDRAGGLSIAPSSQPDDAPTADAPPASESAAPWDDWDDWDNWTNAAAEATTDPPAAPSDVAEDPASQDPASQDPASEDPAPEHPAHEDAPAEHTAPEAGEPTPAPSPRRAPTVRSEESLSAMAELAALLGDDGPAPSASTTPSPAPAADPPRPSGAGSTPAGTAASEPPVPPTGSHTSPTSPASPTSPTPNPPPAGAQHTPDGSGSAADHGDRLATVSQLPVRPRPFDDEQGPPPPAPPVDEEPRPGNDQVASGETIDWTNFTAKGKKRRFGR